MLLCLSVLMACTPAASAIVAPFNSTAGDSPSVADRDSGSRKLLRIDAAQLSLVRHARPRVLHYLVELSTDLVRCPCLHGNQ